MLEFHTMYGEKCPNYDKKASYDTCKNCKLKKSVNKTFSICNEKDENKLNLTSDKPIWILDTVERDFQRLYDHYRSIANQNDYLRKEIEKVKSEKYADEELSRLKSEYDKMKSDYYRGFPISEEEDKKINEWIEKQMKKVPGIGGASGGRFTYQFTPTGLGTAGTITDGFTGDKFTFQELG